MPYASSSNWLLQTATITDACNYQRDGVFKFVFTDLVGLVLVNRLGGYQWQIGLQKISPLI